MVSTGQDEPALRASATTRELERIRAKRRLLETAAAAKAAPTPSPTFIPEFQQQAPPVPKPSNDPVNRNARIKSNARKLLDQLQAADTSLGDSSHNLKLMFAKQALRALADRQAAVAAETQQRKLDQLRERLEEEHRRQHQAKHQQAVQAQLQGQPVALVPTQLLAQAAPVAHGPAAPSPPPVPPALATHPSAQRLHLGHTPQPRHRSRSRSDLRRRSPSRRSPSPARRTPSPSRRSSSPVEQENSNNELEFAGGHSTDGSDGTRNDAMHVRDTHRRSASRSRDRHHHGQDKYDEYGSRSRAPPYYREPRHAGPTEAGVRGAVSAQALSALLAGLQSHGVNLTSGPPPSAPPPAAAAAGQSDLSDGGPPAYQAPGGGGGGGGGGRGGGAAASHGRAAADGTAGEQQYVLLPDGTVGLVHTIVKPAVLQPQVTSPGQAPPPSPPPHAVPLVLLQPGSAGAAAAPALATWPSMPPPGHPYPYGTAAAPAVAAPPSPYYPPSPHGAYGAQAQYPYAHPGFGLPGSLAPPGFAYPTAAGVPAAAPPPPVPPFISHYPGPDGYYYRQQQQGNQEAATPSQSPTPGSGGPQLQEHQGHTYSQWRPDSNPNQHTGRTGPQSHLDAMGAHVRHSISSLSSDPYGGSVLIGGPTEDGAGGGPPRAGGGGYMRGGGLSAPPPSAATGSPQGQQQQVPVPPSTGSSITTMPSSGAEPGPGNGGGGSGIYGGGRYHHRHSHSGAESLRSLPSNSGGSLRGGPGSVSLSQQYEATLASPSPRDSLQNLDSPASFRDMPRRASGSVSLSPLRSTGGGVGGSIDSGPHFTSGPGGDSGSRRRPSPLYISSSAASGPPGDPAMPPAAPSGSSGSSSGGSVVLRVTLPPGSLTQSTSPFAAGEEQGGMGSGTGAGDEPSLLLRTLDLGSPSLQRSKLSDDQVETPTSRKPSLTSPWSSSGPSDAPIGLSGGVGSGSNTGMYTSARDLLSDVVSRPPLYGTSLPYGTAGLYDRYTAGGFYAAAGSLYSPSPMYGGPGAGIGAGGGSGSGFTGFGVNNNNSSGSLGDRGPGGGGGGGVTAANVTGIGGMTQRSPSSDSIRSAGAAARAYGGTANTMGLSNAAALPTSSAATDLLGTSAALALTAAILEGSAASAAASSIIAGSTVGLSAASVQGLSQLGLSHLHPTGGAAASTSSGAAAAVGSSTVASPSSPGHATAGLGRTSSSNRGGGGMGSDNGSAGGVGVGPGQQGMSPSSVAANAALMARFAHTSGPDNMFSPRTRSRVQLMGNDDLTDGLSPRSGNPSLTNVASPGALTPSQQQQLTSGGSMRLTAAALNAQQQAYQQQAPLSPAQPSPSSRLASRSPGGASAAGAPSGATDIGGLQPTVPTLRLPPRATSRMLGGAVAAAPPPLGGAASVPSSETASPTRTEQLGFGDTRDMDMEQSLSARSGRSALSEAQGGGAATLLSTASTGDRVSGVPVVEHRDSGVDTASYPGMLGAQAVDTAALAGGGAAGMMGQSGVMTSGGGAAMPAAAASIQQQAPPGLPPLMELLNNSPFSAASPSGSTALSPLGFGGGSTPLERSADSFVRFGSMPFSGAASPMATGNPIDFLGSPTKYPQGQAAGGQRGSSGGTSSAGGGAGGGAGGSSGGAVGTSAPSASTGAARAGALPTSISVAVPQQQQQTAPPTASSQQPAAVTSPGGPSLGLQSQLQPQQQQQHPQQQQQQLSGMSFRVSNTGGPGASAGGVAAPGAAQPSGGGLPHATSISTSSPSTAAAAAAASRGFSPAGSQSARFPSTAPAQASPSQRGTAGSFAAVGSGSVATGAPARTGTPAILSRVLSGRGEFDSDDEDEGAAVGPTYNAALVRGPGAGGGSSQRVGGGSGLITGGSVSAAPRVSAVASGLMGRGTLTAGSAAHDDDFNFNF